MTITFTQDRETKNTVRFNENVEGDAKPVVGTLYLKKDQAADLGSKVKVVITKA